MNETELLIFQQLFHEAAAKCFGHAAIEPLSETESKLFYNRILEETGLVVGWKSLKNYSIAIFDKTKSENPSVPTLDTLARYVLNAPYTDELYRKRKESHYPYWFDYKSNVVIGERKATSPVKGKSKVVRVVVAALVAAVTIVAYFIFAERVQEHKFFADFGQPVKPSVDGWAIKDIDTIYWKRRNENPGYLTLFTLEGR